VTDDDRLFPSVIQKKRREKESHFLMYKRETAVTYCHLLSPIITASHIKDTCKKVNMVFYFAGIKQFNRENKTP